MDAKRNHPKPEHVDPFDLPDPPAGDVVPVRATAPAMAEEDVDAVDRVEKRRHATG